MDEVTCDDEASVANKTKPDNQSLGVAVFVRLTRNTPQKGANNIVFARRTAIDLFMSVYMRRKDADVSNDWILRLYT